MSKQFDTKQSDSKHGTTKVQSLKGQSADVQKLMASIEKLKQEIGKMDESINGIREKKSKLEEQMYELENKLKELDPSLELKNHGYDDVYIKSIDMTLYELARVPANERLSLVGKFQTDPVFQTIAKSWWDQRNLAAYLNGNPNALGWE